jgi:hypothetical protein
VCFNKNKKVDSSIESYLKIQVKIKVMVGIILGVATAKVGVVSFITAKYIFWSRMIMSIDTLNIKIRKNVLN